jgi:hypothetical protein
MGRLSIRHLVALLAGLSASCSFSEIDKEGKRCETSCDPLACVEHVCTRAQSLPIQDSFDDRSEPVGAGAPWDKYDGNVAIRSDGAISPPNALLAVRDSEEPLSTVEAALAVGSSKSRLDCSFGFRLDTPIEPPDVAVEIASLSLGSAWVVLTVSSGAAGDTWSFFSFGNGSGIGATLLTPNAWHQATITAEGAAGQLRVSVGSEELGAQPGYLDFPDVVRFAIGVDDLDGEISSARVRFDDVQCAAQ